jgi:hypothetical protein
MGYMADLHLCNFAILHTFALTIRYEIEFSIF